jgi:hypothetical protein
MFKVILMMKKRPELSRQEFIDYYNNSHLPYVLSLLPGVPVSVHRRNFTIPDAGGSGTVERGAADNDRFDVITEVIYDAAEGSQEALKGFEDPEIRRKIQEDEDKFILPGSMRRYVVEVHEAHFDRAGA